MQTEKEKNEGDLEHVYIKNWEYWVFDELGRLAYPIRNQGTREEKIWTRNEIQRRRISKKIWRRRRGEKIERDWISKRERRSISKEIERRTIQSSSLLALS